MWKYVKILTGTRTLFKISVGLCHLTLLPEFIIKEGKFLDLLLEASVTRSQIIRGVGRLFVVTSGGT